MEPTLTSSLRKVIRKNRKTLFVALLGLFLSNILLVLNPLLFRQAVLIMGHSSEGQDSSLRFFVERLLGPYAFSISAWVLLLLIIAAISSSLKYMTRVRLIAISRVAEQKLRSKLFSKIQNQSMEFFDRHGTGELLSRLTNDISVYRDVMGPGIMFPSYFITMIIPGIWGLFHISPSLASFSLVPLLVIPIANYLFKKPIYQTSKTLQEQLAKMSDEVQEHYSGIRIIRAFTAEEGTFAQFKKICKKFIRLSVHLDVLEGVFYPLLFMLTRLINVAIIFFAGWMVMKGYNELSAADFLSFMWIQSYIYFPILMLGWVIPIYQQGRAAYDRIYEVYQEPIAVVDHTISQYPLKIPAKADIEFRNLSFTYPGKKEPVLKNISLTVKGGQFVGITGPTGAGKSTLFKLLNREYEIPDGMIFIAGHDIHAYPLAAFHEQIVTVEQIPFLFSKTIGENVLFGDAEATQEQMINVAQQADLHETVLNFPKQYDTMVGERGVTLSGGQKQRIAMARAFLVDRSIILLDDVFSSVDTMTEKRIFEALKANYADKTVLLITHRISLLQQLDRVLYLSDGKILEDGSPQELLRKKGAFAALADLYSFTKGEI